MSNFYREELQEIREKSRMQSQIEGLSASWKRAYERLADAADHLDAMIARTESYGVNAMEVLEWPSL